MRSRRLLWSWQLRHLSFETSRELLTWQSLQWSWLSIEAWLCVSGPGELAKKSSARAVRAPSAHIAKAPSPRTQTTSRLRIVGMASPGCMRPGDVDVSGGERGEQHRERHVDLLPRV